SFKHNDEEKALIIPDSWQDKSPAYAQGKIKHVALGLHMCRDGANDEEKKNGEEYLSSVAENQIKAGAAFLDVNVDEFSSDTAVSLDMMKYAVSFLSDRYEIPLSIDSSNPDILTAGLNGCRKDIKKPMLNSVSLERPEMAELAREYEADVIVSAAGKDGLPSQIDDRLENFKAIIKILDDAGVPREKMHLDPLVLPISTDPKNGFYFLEATKKAAEEFEGVHLTGGLSNVSFGMPNRKLLNITFCLLCADRGTDGGILDPVATPVSMIENYDRDSEPYTLAKNFLEGTDEFGMEYITAHREGRLGE
ncbi:MAG: dihydropteroate synthase, partial [Planctomycetota bacterium]